MKKFTVYYLLILTLVFNLASCGDKEDKEDDAAEPSKTALLTAKTWKISKVSSNGVEMSEDDDPLVTLIMLSTFKFNTDKTYTTTLLESETGTWEFASNETIIVLDSGTDDESQWTITELKENSLKATVNDPTDNSKYQVELVPVP